MVCSGYGWADKGINTRIRKWLCDCTFEDIQSALRTAGPAPFFIFQSESPFAK